MKKIIGFLFAGLLVMVACEQTPDTGKLDNEYLVYTDRDTSVDFSQLGTFYVADSILLINSSSKTSYWTNATATTEIINAFTSNMEDAGFTLAASKAEADMGLQLSYLQETYRFQYYDGYPWWYGYSGYWNWGYWGNWGGWYWPYNISYAYSTGSIIGELVNLTSTQSSSSSLEVIWSCYLNGLLNSAGTLNMSYVIRAIDQAFTQSPYLKN